MIPNFNEESQREALNITFKFDVALKVDLGDSTESPHIKVTRKLAATENNNEISQF